MMWATASARDPRPAVAPLPRQHRHNTLLALLFQWGWPCSTRAGPQAQDPEAKAELRRDLAEVGAKAGRRVARTTWCTWRSSATTGTKVGRRRPSPGRHGECDGQCHPQCVDQRGHLLRHFPTAPRSSPSRTSTRDQVSGTCGRCSAAPTPVRSGAGVYERQPFVPDRAPYLPGPAEQPARRDLRAGAGTLRQVMTCPTPPARSCCSTSSRGAPSPCRFRTST